MASTFGMTRRSGGLRAQDVSARKLRACSRYARPAFVANRFSESSLSPIARTWPHRAKVVPVWSARPSWSTSAMVICTDAWSLAVISRSTKNRSIPTLRGFKLRSRTGRRALAGDVEIDENTLFTRVSDMLSLLVHKLLLTWSFSILSCGASAGLGGTAVVRDDGREN